LPVSAIFAVVFSFISIDIVCRPYTADWINQGSSKNSGVENSLELWSKSRKKLQKKCI
jgi:hypothetical protein